MAPMSNPSDNSSLSAIRHLSLISFASETSASTAIPTPTTTSRSTIPGIGSLTGKALVALGEATLRGAESFAIQVKLKKRKESFPRKDDDDSLDSAELYRDLIELTRRDCYSPGIREQALLVVFKQIQHSQTRLLLKYLLKWPVIEISLLLRELMLCMPWKSTKWKPYQSELHLKLEKVLRDSWANYPHFGGLLTSLISASDKGVSAFVGAQGADMVIEAYLTCDVSLLNSLDPETMVAEDLSGWTVAAEHPSFHPDMFAHPLPALLQNKFVTPFEMIVTRIRDRRLAWKGLGLEDVKKRLEFWTWPRWPTHGNTTAHFDPFLDLLEFLCSDVYSLSVTETALSQLFRCMGGDLYSKLGYPYLDFPLRSSRRTVDGSILTSPFTALDPYNTIIAGLWSIVERFQSISLKRRIGENLHAEYPYHVQTTPADGIVFRLAFSRDYHRH